MYDWTKLDGNVFDYELVYLNFRPSEMTSTRSITRKPNVKERLNHITCLETDPPRSLVGIRNILAEAIQNILRKLSKMEKDYYGDNMNAIDDIKNIKPHILSVMESAHVSEIKSANDLEAIFQIAVHPKKKFHFDIEAVQGIRTTVDKLYMYVPKSFSEVIEDLKVTVGYMSKYCLSFYNDNSDVEYGTGKDYSKMGREIPESVNKNIEHIFWLPRRFEEKYLTIDYFSGSSRDVAVKTECYDFVFVLIFFESCEQVKNACNDLSNWLRYDANYAGFVRNDVVQLTKILQIRNDEYRRCQHKCHQTKFRLHYLEDDCNRLELEFSRNNIDEGELRIRQEKLLTRRSGIQVDIEIKEFRRDELKKPLARRAIVVHETADNLIADIRNSKSRLPAILRELSATGNKLQWIKEKKGAISCIKTKIKEEIEELEICESSREKADKEFNECEKQLQLAKHIFKCKTSPDAVEKVLHHLPVASNKTRMPGRLDKTGKIGLTCTISPKV